MEDEEREQDEEKDARRLREKDHLDTPERD